MDFSGCDYENHCGTTLCQMYMKYRPVYPQTMYDTILSYHKESPDVGFDLAVDAACGSGQVTVPLAGYFKQVIGTDISKDQLSLAPKLPNVSYRETPAEDMTFVQDGSVDMVTVGIALHWLNVDKFLQEVDRVLKPGGSFVVFGYCYPELMHKKANEYFRKFFLDLTVKYMGNDRIKFMQGFDTLETPFTQSKRCEDVEIKLDWTLDQFIGYINSHSMTNAFINDNKNRDVFGEFQDELSRILWDKKTFDNEKKIALTFKVWLVMYHKNQ